MSNEPQNSRLDSLIGIFRAFLRIDPMMALIAILIIAPIALPIGSAILNGETEVMITFVMFIAAITLVVYIPLIIVRANVSKEEIYSKLKKKSINEEIKSRQEDKQHARKHTSRIVNARLANMEAQTKAIIDNIPHFERFLLHEEAEKIKKALAVNFKEEDLPKSRLGLVVEFFEAIDQKFEKFETILPGLQQTIEDLKKQIQPIPLYSNVKSALEQQMQGMADMIQDLENKLLEKEAEIESLRIDRQAIIDENKNKNNPDLVTLDPRENRESVFNEVDIPESMKASLAIHQTTKIQENGATQADQEFFKEALDVVEKMEDSKPLGPDIPIPAITQTEADRQTLAPINYWECHYCQNKNPVKAPRCRKCSKGKKLVD